jgi:hypothetical protein
MLNEKLQIMIDKETTEDVLVLHEKPCDNIQPKLELQRPTIFQWGQHTQIK